MTQCKDLNSDMTSGYVHIDITYFFYLSIRIKLYYFVIYNHVISVNVADFLFCVCYFKKKSEKCEDYTESAFCIGVTIQDLKGKFTSKNDIETSKYTNWGTNETNSGGVEDCAVIFRLFYN